MFQGSFDGDRMTCEVDGFTVTARLHRDDNGDAPWEQEDGHGPVSDWRTAERWHDGPRPIKDPGELVLHQAGRGRHPDFRLYDFAEACRIARRDGWGFAPGELRTVRNSGGLWAAWFEGVKGLNRVDGSGMLAGFATEAAAIAAIYAAHRATMTPRQYAARAAMADFERLRAWCNDEWHYVGVAVTVERAGVQLTDKYAHAVWGIESDAGEYLTETANDLIDEALADARAKIAELAAA